MGRGGGCGLDLSGPGCGPLVGLPMSTSASIKGRFFPIQGTVGFSRSYVPCGIKMVNVAELSEFETRLHQEKFLSLSSLGRRKVLSVAAARACLGRICPRDVM
jgi:hypothetical protein